MGDLTGRRGHMLGMEGRGTTPNGSCCGAAGSDVRLCHRLRSMTQGRASYSMEFHHYPQLTSGLADEIVAKARS